MKTFVYGARFEPGDEGGVVVAFPDVPEAITQGVDKEEARVMAQEALGLALLTYPARGKPLPPANALGADVIMIAVDPEDAAKIALLDAFREAGISKSEFGRRIGKDEKEVRRLLDPAHPSKLSSVTDALRQLGRRLIVSVEAVEAAA
jgi:antitoxin HicB